MMVTTTSATTTANQAEPRPAVVRVRPETAAMSRQGLPHYIGISGATAGTRHLSMKLVVIPPGGAAEPHSHRDFETAIYIIQGRVETRHGARLEESTICEAGDFLFIAPGEPHQPVNLSTTEPALAVVARDDPNEQESVVPYCPAAG
jgi:uncharacterized RmlC-like cupin family protein